MGHAMPGVELALGAAVDLHRRGREDLHDQSRRPLDPAVADQAAAARIQVHEVRLDDADVAQDAVDRREEYLTETTSLDVLPNDVVEIPQDPLVPGTGGGRHRKLPLVD